MKIRFAAMRQTGIQGLVAALLGGLIIATAPPRAVAAEPARSGPLAQSMPAGAVGYVEIAGAGKLVGQIRDSAYLKMATESAQFQALEKMPQYKKAQAVRAIVEAQLGMDLWKVGSGLLSDRLALAVYPRPDGNPAGNALAILRGADPAVLSQIRQRLEPFLALVDEQIETSDGAPGVKVLSFQNQAFVALGESWLAATNARDLLTKSLGLMTGKETGALADDPAFRAMSSQMGAEHVVSAFLNTALLTKAKGSRLTPEKLDNALASMFIGGITELAASSPYAGMTLDVEKNRFVVTSGIAGDSRKLGEAHRVFFSDPAGPGTADIPNLPGLISGFTFYLDIANWYRQREQLLEARILPGFDQFETGVANLLPGRDVGEDVVPLVGKHVTFVAAPQDYSHLEGRPGIKLPGFAMIVELAKPEEGGDLFQLLFQTISAILNFQAGEQGRQPWVISSETYKDVQISFGRYLKKPTGDQLPLVFNFMPASARVGDKFVISSSLGTCRQLIDALTAPAAPASRPNRNLNFEVHAGTLAEILEANKEVFEARAIQQGTEAPQALVQFSGAVQLLKYFDTFRLSTRVLPESFQVQFEGSWK